MEPWSLGLCAVVLLCCGAALGRELPRRWRMVPVSLMGCVMALVALQWRGVQASVPVEKPPQHEEEYAQSQACASCHAQHFESWQKTWHRTMTQDATPETVQGDFSDVTLTTLGATFHMFRDGGAYFMDVDDRAGRMRAQLPNLISWPLQEDGHTLRFRVDKLLGSHNMQAYLTRLSDGRVILLPLYWHPAEKKWLARTAAFLVPPGEGPMEYTALWNAACVFCHNTRAHAGYIVAGGRDLGFDTQVKEQGIACESCHGPGARHAELNRDPIRRYTLALGGEHDPSIVSPERLDPVRSVESCGRCHGKWHSSEHANMLRHWDDFIPGDEVSPRYHNVFPTQLPTEQMGHSTEMAPKAGFFWPDWTPQTTAMEHQGTIQSLCHQKGGMTCLSCHSMHQSDPDNQLKERDDDRSEFTRHNAMCTQCHKELSSGEAIRAHSHHAPESSGGRCVACHMPYQGYGLLKSVRSHRITRPSVEKTAKDGMPNACNSCHVEKTLAWTSERMAEWWKTPPVELDEAQKEVPATLVEMLRGHALQRALSVLALRRAAEAGDPWVERTAPLILDVMRDEPYHTVRMLAFQALRAQKRFSDVEFDAMADVNERRAKVDELRARIPPEVGGSSVMPISDEMAARLRAERDNRDIFVQE